VVHPETAVQHQHRRTLTDRLDVDPVDLHAYKPPRADASQAPSEPMQVKTIQEQRRYHSTGAPSTAGW
jgi:hypothetical protein